MGDDDQGLDVCMYCLLAPGLGGSEEPCREVWAGSGGGRSGQGEWSRSMAPAELGMPAGRVSSAGGEAVEEQEAQDMEGILVLEGASTQARGGAIVEPESVDDAQAGARGGGGGEHEAEELEEECEKHVMQCQARRHGQQ